MNDRFEPTRFQLEDELERLSADNERLTALLEDCKQSCGEWADANERLRAALVRAYDLVKLGRYQMADKELRKALQDKEPEANRCHYKKAGPDWCPHPKEPGFDYCQYHFVDASRTSAQDKEPDNFGKPDEPEHIRKWFDGDSDGS